MASSGSSEHGEMYASPMANRVMKHPAFLHSMRKDYVCRAILAAAVVNHYEWGVSSSGRKKTYKDLTRKQRYDKSVWTLRKDETDVRHPYVFLFIDDQIHLVYVQNARPVLEVAMATVINDVNDPNETELRIKYSETKGAITYSRPHQRYDNLIDFVRAMNLDPLYDSSEFFVETKMHLGVIRRRINEPEMPREIHTHASFSTSSYPYRANCPTEHITTQQRAIADHLVDGGIFARALTTSATCSHANAHVDVSTALKEGEDSASLVSKGGAQPCIDMEEIMSRMEGRSIFDDSGETYGDSGDDDSGDDDSGDGDGSDSGSKLVAFAASRAKLMQRSVHTSLQYIDGDHAEMLMNTHGEMSRHIAVVKELPPSEAEARREVPMELRGEKGQKILSRVVGALLRDMRTANIQPVTYESLRTDIANRVIEEHKSHSSKRLSRSKISTNVNSILQPMSEMNRPERFSDTFDMIEADASMSSREFANMVMKIFREEKVRATRDLALRVGRLVVQYIPSSEYTKGFGAGYSSRSHAPHRFQTVPSQRDQLLHNMNNGTIPDRIMTKFNVYQLNILPLRSSADRQLSWGRLVPKSAYAVIREQTSLAQSRGPRTKSQPRIYVFFIRDKGGYYMLYMLPENSDKPGELRASNKISFEYSKNDSSSEFEGISGPSSYRIGNETFSSFEDIAHHQFHKASEQFGADILCMRSVGTEHYMAPEPELPANGDSALYAYNNTMTRDQARRRIVMRGGLPGDAFFFTDPAGRVCIAIMWSFDFLRQMDPSKEQIETFKASLRQYQNSTGMDTTSIPRVFSLTPNPKRDCYDIPHELGPRGNISDPEKVTDLGDLRNECVFIRRLIPCETYIASRQGDTLPHLDDDSLASAYHGAVDSAHVKEMLEDVDRGSARQKYIAPWFAFFSSPDNSTLSLMVRTPHSRDSGYRIIPVADNARTGMYNVFDGRFPMYSMSDVIHYLYVMYQDGRFDFPITDTYAVFRPVGHSPVKPGLRTGGRRLVLRGVTSNANRLTVQRIKNAPLTAEDNDRIDRENARRSRLAQDTMSTNDVGPSVFDAVYNPSKKNSLQSFTGVNALAASGTGVDISRRANASISNRLVGNHGAEQQNRMLEHLKKLTSALEGSVGIMIHRSSQAVTEFRSNVTEMLAESGMDPEEIENFIDNINIQTELDESWNPTPEQKQRHDRLLRHVRATLTNYAFNLVAVLGMGTGVKVLRDAWSDRMRRRRKGHALHQGVFTKNDLEFFGDDPMEGIAKAMTRIGPGLAGLFHQVAGQSKSQTSPLRAPDSASGRGVSSTRAVNPSGRGEREDDEEEEEEVYPQGDEDVLDEEILASEEEEAEKPTPASAPLEKKRVWKGPASAPAPLAMRGKKSARKEPVNPDDLDVEADHIESQTRAVNSSGRGEREDDDEENLASEGEEAKKPTPAPASPEKKSVWKGPASAPLEKKKKRKEKKGPAPAPAPLAMKRKWRGESARKEPASLYDLEHFESDSDSGMVGHRGHQEKEVTPYAKESAVYDLVGNGWHRFANFALELEHLYEGKIPNEEYLFATVRLLDKLWKSYSEDDQGEGAKYPVRNELIDEFRTLSRDLDRIAFNSPTKVETYKISWIKNTVFEQDIRRVLSDEAWGERDRSSAYGRTRNDHSVLSRLMNNAISPLQHLEKALSPGEVPCITLDACDKLAAHGKNVVHVPELIKPFTQELHDALRHVGEGGSLYEIRPFKGGHALFAAGSPNDKPLLGTLQFFLDVGSHEISEVAMYRDTLRMLLSASAKDLAYTPPGHTSYAETLASLFAAVLEHFDRSLARRLLDTKRVDPKEDDNYAFRAKLLQLAQDIIREAGPHIQAKAKAIADTYGGYQPRPGAAPPRSRTTSMSGKSFHVLVNPPSWPGDTASLAEEFKASAQGMWGVLPVAEIFEKDGAKSASWDPMWLNYYALYEFHKSGSEDRVSTAIEFLNKVKGSVNMWWDIVQYFSGGVEVTSLWKSRSLSEDRNSSQKKQAIRALGMGAKRIYDYLEKSLRVGMIPVVEKYNRVPNTISVSDVRKNAISLLKAIALKSPDILTKSRPENHRDVACVYNINVSNRTTDMDWFFERYGKYESYSLSVVAHELKTSTILFSRGTVPYSLVNAIHFAWGAFVMRHMEEFQIPNHRKNLSVLFENASMYSYADNQSLRSRIIAKIVGGKDYPSSQDIERDTQKLLVESFEMARSSISRGESIGSRGAAHHWGYKRSAYEHATAKALHDMLREKMDSEVSPDTGYGHIIALFTTFTADIAKNGFLETMNKKGIYVEKLQEITNLPHYEGDERTKRGVRHLGLILQDGSRNNTAFRKRVFTVLSEAVYMLTSDHASSSEGERARTDLFKAGVRGVGCVSGYLFLFKHDEDTGKTVVYSSTDTRIDDWPAISIDIYENTPLEKSNLLFKSLQYLALGIAQLRDSAGQGKEAFVKALLKCKHALHKIDHLGLPNEEKRRAHDSPRMWAKRMLQEISRVLDDEDKEFLTNSDPVEVLTSLYTGLHHLCASSATVMMRGDKLIPRVDFLRSSARAVFSLKGDAQKDADYIENLATFLEDINCDSSRQRNYVERVAKSIIESDNQFRKLPTQLGGHSKPELSEVEEDGDDSDGDDDEHETPLITAYKAAAGTERETSPRRGPAAKSEDASPVFPALFGTHESEGDDYEQDDALDISPSGVPARRGRPLRRNHLSPPDKSKKRGSRFSPKPYGRHHSSERDSGQRHPSPEGLASFNEMGADMMNEDEPYM